MWHDQFGKQGIILKVGFHSMGIGERGVHEWLSVVDLLIVCKLYRF